MDINKIQKNKIKMSSGFTLIELMVATTIFSIIMLMGVGSLVVSSNSAKASHRLRIAVDNVNFALESMTRELRTGTSFYCSNEYTMGNDNLKGDCDGGRIIAFNPQVVPGSPYRVAYYKTARTSNGGGDVTYTLERCEYRTSMVCSDIVSPDVNVNQLLFYVNGSSVADVTQPSVRILMKGLVSLNGVDTPFYLQTMASQRSSE